MKYKRCWSFHPNHNRLDFPCECWLPSYLQKISSTVQEFLKQPLRISSHKTKGLNTKTLYHFFFYKMVKLRYQILMLKKKNVIVCPEELVYTEPLFALFLITRCLHQLPHQLPGSFRSTSGLMRRWVMWWRSGKYLNSCAVKKTHTVIRMCSADQPASSLVVVSRMNTEKPTQQRLG